MSMIEFNYFPQLTYSLLFSISWCDNLVPNLYGTEVYLTCSLHDAQDVIIFQVSVPEKSLNLFYFTTTTDKTWR